MWVFACNQFCLISRCEVGYGTRCQPQLKTSILELNHGGVTALAHHKPEVRTVGHRFLSDTRKERMEEPLQPKQEEPQKIAKVSRCRSLTHKNGCGQFFRTRPQCNAHGRYIVHAGKEPYKPRSVEGWRLLKGTPGKNQIGFVMQTLVSDDQGLMCIEILVPTASVMVDTAWVRGNRGGTQLARQDRELEPEIEGIEVVSAREGTAVAPSQRETSRLGIGRRLHFHRFHLRRQPTDCTQVSQKSPHRASRDGLLLSHKRAVPFNRCGRPTYHLAELGTRVIIRTHLTFLSVQDEKCAPGHKMIPT